MANDSQGDFLLAWFIPLTFFTVLMCLINAMGALPMCEQVDCIATCTDKQMIPYDDGLAGYTVTFGLDDGRILKSCSYTMGMENTYIIYSQVDLNKRYIVNYDRKTYTVVNSGGLYRINSATLING